MTSHSALLVLLFSMASLSAHAIDINATLFGLNGQGTLTLDAGTFTVSFYPIISHKVGFELVNR